MKKYQNSSANTYITRKYKFNENDYTDSQQLGLTRSREQILARISLISKTNTQVSDPSSQPPYELSPTKLKGQQIQFNPPLRQIQKEVPYSIQYVHKLSLRYQKKLSFSKGEENQQKQVANCVQEKNHTQHQKSHLPQVRKKLMSLFKKPKARVTEKQNQLNNLTEEANNENKFLNLREYSLNLNQMKEGIFQLAQSEARRVLDVQGKQLKSLPYLNSIKSRKYNPKEKQEQVSNLQNSSQYINSDDYNSNQIAKDNISPRVPINLKPQYLNKFKQFRKFTKKPGVGFFTQNKEQFQLNGLTYLNSLLFNLNQNQSKEWVLNEVDEQQLIYDYVSNLKQE